MLTPSRESHSTLEIPTRPVRAIAQESVADLDSALERLTAYGVRCPPMSRLHQARQVLQEAAATGVLVPRHRGDALGLRALEFGFDYAAIAATLPDRRNKTVRQDLEASLTGPLDPPETSRGPLQLQSQFVVRAALVRSGVIPSHPNRRSPMTGKSPDLVADNGLSQYGIEAKRPQAAHNVVPRMEDARAQLQEYGLPGAILIDVTDCVRGLSSSDVDDAVRHHALELYGRIFVTGQAYRPGYSGIMVAGTYARVAWTSEDRDQDAMVNVHTCSTIGLFAAVQNSLLDHRGRWLRSSFQDGLHQLSQTLAERGE